MVTWEGINRLFICGFDKKGTDITLFITAYWISL